MRYWLERSTGMSTYLDKLIEGVKGELARECERVGHVPFPTKKKETQETGTLRRLEQRLEVLLAVRAMETAANRDRAISSAQMLGGQGHGGARRRRQQK
jgi:hypothetical protein